MMKKLICIAVVLAGFVGTISAQAPIEETKRVNQDEVPVAILKTYEADFGPITEGAGFWTLYYTQYNKDVAGRLTEKEVFTPIAYVYKNKANKSEARFNANGKLESSKGLVVQPTHGER